MRCVRISFWASLCFVPLASRARRPERRLSSIRVVVSLSWSAYEVVETNASVTMVVNRGGATNVAFTVDYATTNGTAVACEDYVAQSGTLIFAAGVNSRVLTIPVLDDGLVEGDETFTVQLSNPSGGAVLSPQSTATLVIH